MRKVVWDLCSGLGGWSEAFVQDDWIVIRIEINPELAHIPHTLTLDVLNCLDWMYELPSPDLILASPPCTEFSLAQNFHNGRVEDPNLEIAMGCKWIIEMMKPKFWCVENVAGACKFFEPIFGKHRQRAGPFFLWGNFPWLALDPSFTHEKTKDEDRLGRNLRPNVRGMIPFQISFKMLSGIYQHRTLEEYL